MAAPAYRASGAATLGNTTTSVTINKPTGTVSGDILYAVIANGGANAAPSSVPSGWTLVDSAGVTPTDPFWGGLYRLVAGGSEPADYTWSGMTDSCTGCIIGISGADTTTPEQVHAVRYNASGAVGTAGVTTTGANTLVVSCYAEDDNNSVTTNSWTTATDPALTHRIEQTSSGGNDTGAAFATGTKATAGATGATSFTLSAARQNVSFTFAVQAAGAASGTATDTLTLTDVATRTLITTGTVSDSVTLADTASRVVADARATADALTLTDTAAGFRTQLSSATDALSLSDAAAALTVKARTSTDTLALSDVATKAGTYARTATDGLTLSDAAAVTAGQSATATDALTLSDTATRTRTSARTAADLLALADAAARALLLARPVADAIHLVDTATSDGHGPAQDITIRVGRPTTAWTAAQPARDWAAGPPTV